MGNVRTLDSSTPVLIIPGLDGTTGLVELTAPKLFPGRPVFLFGHEYHPLEGGVDSIAERAMASIEDHLEPGQRVYVCGESFGGLVALSVARRWPERVRGLVLLSTFGWYPPAAARRGRMGLMAWRLVGDRGASLALRLGRLLGVVSALGLKTSREVIVAYLHSGTADLVGYRRKCELALTFDGQPWIGRLEVPVFILSGTLDPVVPASAGRALHEALPHSELHILRGGHLVHFSAADEVGQRISLWMRAHEEESRSTRDPPSAPGLE